MRSCLTITCFLVAWSLSCQSYGAWKFYSEAYDNQSNGMVVDTVSGIAYISIGRICEEPTLRECAELLAIDSGGSQIYRRRYVDLDIGGHSIMIRSDSILLFGNRSPYWDGWVVKAVTSIAGDSLTSMDLLAESSLLEYYLISVSEVKDRIFTIGNVRIDRRDIGVLSIADQDLLIDTTIFLDTLDQGIFTDIYAIDDTTIAVVYDEEGDRSIGKRYKWVAFYDTRTYHRTWQYRHNEEVDNARSRGLSLGGGDFLFDLGAEVKGSRFVRMNRDSVFQWQRDFYRGGAGRYHSLITREVIKTQDGHILIAGTCTDLCDFEYLPSDSPCLTKLDSNTGDIMWQRVIYQEDHFDPSLGETGIVSDVVELPSGDLVASIQMWEAEKTAVVLLRTDSDGCITPDCGKYIDLDELAVSSEEVEADQQAGIRVYPNPTSDRITIEAIIPVCTVALILLDGRRMELPFTAGTPQKTIINLPQELPSGLYVIQVIGQDGKTYNERLVLER